MITEDGYIKRMHPELYRVQKRGGKGVIGATTKEDDTIAKVLSTMTHDDLLFFTNTGKVFQTKAYEIPVSSRTAKGQAIVNFLQVAPGRKNHGDHRVWQRMKALNIFLWRRKSAPSKKPSLKISRTCRRERT